MFNHKILFIIAVAFGVFGAFMGWSYGLVIGIIVGITLLNIGFYLYVMLQSQNIKLINYLLSTNIKEPAYAYIVALKNENIDEAITQLKKAVRKYKNTTHENSYAFILAILNEDFDAARNYALAMENEGIRTYNLALLDAYEGNGEQHLDTVFSKPWMSAAIKTTHYFTQQSSELYERYKLETLQLSKGIQHAANLYTIQFNENKHLFGIPATNSTSTNIH